MPRKLFVCTWMSYIGSYIVVSGFFHPNIPHVQIGYIPLSLTSDPNFLRTSKVTVCLPYDLSPDVCQLPCSQLTPKRTESCPTWQAHVERYRNSPVSWHFCSKTAARLWLFHKGLLEGFLGKKYMMYFYEVEGNFRIEFGVPTQGTKKLNAVERRFFHGFWPLWRAVGARGTHS